MPTDYAVLIVHYHLNGGGVTRIIEQQCQALKQLGIPHLVLCGEKKISTEIPHFILPSLHFSTSHDTSVKTQLEKEIRQIADTHFSQPVLFHFHNHAIGLNPYFQELVWKLSQDYRMTLHVHDFIEDGRKANLPNISQRDHLYPNAEHIQYVNINSRDLNILQSAGADSILLPNSYREVPREDTPSTDWIFYPVQALRRKNLGEILLLSLATPSPYRYAIAVTPPEQQQSTARWQQLATELKLDIAFDVTDQRAPHSGATQHFCSWYEHACKIVSTSIQEGFGMVFIEPIYFQTPFFGRDLPEITQDIKEQGVQHPHLYQSIHIDLPGFPQKDFGFFTEAQQRSLLTTLAADRSLLRHVHLQSNGSTIRLTTFLQTVFAEDKALPLSSIDPWSLQQLKKNLSSLYHTLSQRNIGKVTSLQHASIQQTFLQQITKPWENES